VASRQDEPMIRIAVGPDRYLSGESGAVVQALSGGLPVPAFRTVPSAVRGVDGLPTLVHNVETLARVARLARAEDCSTAIVTVCVDDAHVVLEVPTSATVHEVITRVTGPAEPAAVLIGGHGGTWCGWPRLDELTLDEADFRAAGLSRGAGVLAVLPAGACGLARTAALADFLAKESARQCGPCLFGLASIAASTAELAGGGRRSRRDADRIARFAAEIQGRGACGHPDGAVRMVRSALEVFAGDVDAHRRGRCLATGGRL
jgi:NADH:ubiquinone oxidoreductase subunit F (NADH-binding)